MKNSIFNEVYIFSKWTDGLKGKLVFASDSFIELKELVENRQIQFRKRVMKSTSEYENEFTLDYDYYSKKGVDIDVGMSYQYVYFDPNYDNFISNDTFDTKNNERDFLDWSKDEKINLALNILSENINNMTEDEIKVFNEISNKLNNNIIYGE